MAPSEHNIFPKSGNKTTDWAGKKIGLLGGSFNPAHDAHLELSLTALEKLDLDAVWWLVSPQNPLKSDAHMASLNQRIENAQAMASDPRIYITDLERNLGTRYTADTLGLMITLLPDANFVWLMGADNLAQFTEWKDWKKMAATVVFAIFDRPGYSNAVEESEAAQYLRDHQIPSDRAAELGTMKAPAWTFIRDIYNPLSSTEIRRKKH